MKKIFGLKMFAALVAVSAGMFIGCASTKAYTITKNTDGSTTKSYVSVTGLGDKAAAVAAEGVFADGNKDDLGAGLKNATASQKSSGADKVIAALGTALVSVVTAQPGTRSAPVATPETVNVSSAPAITASSIASEKKVYVDRTLTTGGNNPEIVIIGNRESCSLCRGLWSQIDVASLSAATCDSNIVDADATDNPSVYSAKRPRTGFSYPYIRVYLDGNIVDEFSARGMSQSDIASRSSKVIGECAATAKSNE